MVARDLCGSGAVGFGSVLVWGVKADSLVVYACFGQRMSRSRDLETV